jgi:hypothetical protein
MCCLLSEEFMRIGSSGCYGAILLLCFGGGDLRAVQADIQPENQLSAESKLYGEYEQGRDLAKEAASSSGDVRDDLIVKEHQVGSPNGEPDPYTSKRIAYLCTSSEAIVIGKVISKSSAFTARRGFVFTHYEVQIQTLFVDRNQRLNESGILALSAPGGDATIDGHVVHATVSNLPPLQVENTYLLFLKYIPQSVSYKYSTPDVFKLSGGSVIPMRLGVDAPAASLLNNEADFLDAIRAWISRY